MLIKAEAARLARKTDAPVIAAGSTGSIPATAELIATIARLPHGAVVLPGLDTDLDEPSWRLIAGDEGKGIRAGARPSAIRHAGAARAHRHRPRRGRQLWRRRAAASGSSRRRCGRRRRPTCGGKTPPMPGSQRTPTPRCETLTRDRSGQCRGGGARHRGGAARSGARGQDRGAGHARPRARPPRARRARALEHRGRGFRRRCARRNAGRNFCPARRRSRARRACAGHAAGFAQASAAAASACSEQPSAPSPRWNARSCAGRARAAAAPGLAHALKPSRTTEKFRAQRKADLHPSDPRTALARWRTCRRRRNSSPRSPKRWRRSKASPPRALPLQRHRRAPSRGGRPRCRATAARRSPSPGRTAPSLRMRSTNWRQAAPPPILLVEPRDYAELFCARARRPRRAAAAAAPGMRVRILGLARSAAHRKRPRRARRPGRGHLAAGKPQRCLAQPADAAAARPRSAGAPHRPLRARFRAAARRARSDPHAAPPRSPARRPCRRASSSASPRSPATRWKAARARGEAYLAWARELDRPGDSHSRRRSRRRSRRAPRGRKSLSVTEIEDWLRDPYTIYAKHILRLQPLDPVDARPGAAERGTFIHAAIGEFTQLLRRRACRADPARELIALGRPHFAALEDFPEARAFWWPRFVRIARWFARWELERRAGITDIAAEIRGEIDIPLADGAFKLRGIADRIERDADGRYVILDYKTGSARTEKQVRTGLAPQLTLEAAMLRRGGFKDIPAGASVAEIVYVTAQRRRAGRANSNRSSSRRAPPTARPTARWKSSRRWPRASTTTTSPIARWCIRCGRPITATTTIWRGSRNGRATGGENDDGSGAGRPMRSPAAIPDPPCGGCRPRCPTRTCRPGSPPTPARARPTCWRSASSIFCSTASSRKKFSASPSPRPPPPTWPSACSTRSRSGPRSTMPRSMKPSANARA